MEFKNLTDEQLDTIIKITNYVYDEAVGESGNYKRWHEIACKIAFEEYNVLDYKNEPLDKRTEVLMEQEGHDAQAFYENQLAEQHWEG